MQVDEFLLNHELCRIATVSSDCTPHVVPVSYIYHDSKFYVSTDYGTKKLRNILGNPAVAIVVDDVGPNAGVLIHGKAKIIERGQKWKTIYDIFYSKFSWVRRSPWKEGEAPFIEIKIKSLTKWGL